MDESTAIESKLHEVTLARSKIERCAITTCPLALRKFPPEIREMIFKHCMPEYAPKTPEILIALRGDQGLYHEAIRIYHEINFYTFRPNALAAYDVFPENLAAKIQKLHVPDVPWPGVGYLRPPLPTVFSHCRAVTQLSISPHSFGALVHWVEVFLNQLRTVKKLCVTIPCEHLASDAPTWVVILARGLELVDAKIGTTKRLCFVSSGEDETWSWEAPSERILMWSHRGHLK
jgi:hypothetical protein